jgi:sterol desaturase/sphingolipid hydroxylase (fatty acid hydroxylase superfamily)
MILSHNDVSVRLGFFFGVFITMALWEVVAPRKQLVSSKPVRWLSNLSVTFLNSFLVRLIFPLLAVDVAYMGAERGWGIFNNIGVPEPVAGIICVIALDLLIYAQHVVFHRVGPFWRLHRMHHADMDIDVTTGSRFHPIEIILSMIIKMAAVFILGAPVWSVLVFEILLNATAMFNHANAYIPTGVDRVLRLFVVTPDMHRVHHSPIIKETNSNYGFNLPWWDRLFGTYIAQPARGHTDMKIGLANYRDPKKNTLPWMLAIPFQSRER